MKPLVGYDMPFYVHSFEPMGKSIFDKFLDALMGQGKVKLNDEYDNWADRKLVELLACLYKNPNAKIYYHTRYRIVNTKAQNVIIVPSYQRTTRIKVLTNHYYFNISIKQLHYLQIKSLVKQAYEFTDYETETSVYTLSKDRRKLIKKLIMSHVK